jgi:methionine biosynthesis protein MetW
MPTFKSIIRRLLPKSLYVSLANGYEGLRRLFIYPDTARVGEVDYDEYWESKAKSGMGHLSAWRLRRARVFADLIDTGARVMDLGVGDGAILEYLVARKEIQAYGVDISPAAVEFCRGRGLNVDLVDVQKSVSDYLGEPFDYIILSEVLEHLPDPESLLDDLRPYVQKGFLISIPNTGFFTHRLRLLLGKFPLQWIVSPGEHLRFWTLADFRWWADQLGFEIVSEVPYEGPAGLRTLWPKLFAAGIIYQLRDKRSL